ncbi:hypothetical protein Tco_0389552 [Tanacetum coccineum]
MQSNTHNIKHSVTPDTDSCKVENNIKEAGETDRVGVLKLNLNNADWKNFRPEFVNVAADWDGIFESWMKEEWVRRSKVGAENRKRVPGDVEEANNEYHPSKVIVVVEEMAAISTPGDSYKGESANEYGKRPSNLELFEKFCKKNRHEGDRGDARSEKVARAPIIIANVVDLALDLHLDPEA